VEVPIKTTQLPISEKRRSSTAPKQDLAPYKQQVKEEMIPKMILEMTKHKNRK
jgi:hypothetical protein